MTTSVLVVGATGQLGSALVDVVSRATGDTQIRQPAVTWSDVDLSVRQISNAIDDWLADDAESYRLFWAAGASVTSASFEAVDAERSVFRSVINHLSQAIARSGTSRSIGFFFASSAGGVYSGSPSPAPFTEHSPTGAAAPYGVAKLAMEAELDDLASAGIAVLIGRLTTLYGPRQRSGKAQGFLSHLCNSYIRGTPLSIYVSLDTMRDYIHSDDAALVAVRGLEIVCASGPATPIVKNIGSLAPSTLGHVLSQAKLVFKRRARVVIASSPLSSGQVNDLRIGSVVLPELDLLPRRPLLVGLAETRAAMELRFRTASS